MMSIGYCNYMQLGGLFMSVWYYIILITYLTRHLTYKIVLEKSDAHLYDTYNYYTQLIRS